MIIPRFDIHVLLPSLLFFDYCATDSSWNEEVGGGENIADEMRIEIPVFFLCGRIAMNLNNFVPSSLPQNEGNANPVACLFRN